MRSLIDHDTLNCFEINCVPQKYIIEDKKNDHIELL